MKRYLFKIFIFLALFACANVAYLFIVQKFDWNFAKGLEMKAFVDQDYDVLIIGNSLALDGFDMVQLKENGIHAFNTSIAGASIKSNYIQLEEYLKKNKAPKLVVQGLSAKMMEFNEDKIHPIVEYTHRDLKPSYKSLPMIKFKWLGYEVLKKVVSKHHRNAKIIDGQLRTERKLGDYTKYPDFSKEGMVKEVYEGATYLAKIDSLCNVLGIKKVNIEMPTYKTFQNDEPLGLTSFQNAMGIQDDYFNFNNRNFCEIFDNQNDWLGNSHLNVFGSKKFTKELIDVGIFKY